jgi:CelD/BcsL family acetyltransferase involved in cellulose biosynthesis
MNVVALRSFNHDARVSPASGCRMARVAVFNDLAAAEPHWRALEREDHLATPYQAYDFLKAWQHHIGAASGVTPFIVTGFNAQGEPLFVWPFGLRRCAGLRVAEFLGGKHSNFNMALWRRDAAASIGAAELHAVLAELDGKADAIMLSNQPLIWAGAANPFALLPHQASPSSGHSGALTGDFEALLEARASAPARRKMRKKKRALEGLGKVAFETAKSDADVTRVLADFFAQKTARMRAIGLPNVFEQPGVQRFIESAAMTRTASGNRLIELYTLALDGTIVATLGGVAGDGRFSAMFTSIIHGRFRAESPGEQLLVRVVQQCCERGFHTFDLGIGEAKYKDLFCDNAEAMFDSYWPLTPAGRLAAFAMSNAAAAKRAVKQHPALWSIVQAIRRLRAWRFGKA